VADNRSIEYTLKIVNDPANRAAVAQATEQLAAIQAKTLTNPVAIARQQELQAGFGLVSQPFVGSAAWKEAQAQTTKTTPIVAANIEEMELHAKALQEDAARYQQQAASARESTLQLERQTAEMKAQTAQIGQTILAEKRLYEQQKLTANSGPWGARPGGVGVLPLPVPGGGGGGGGRGGGGGPPREPPSGFFGGIAAGEHEGHGLGETARLSQSGLRLNIFSHLNSMIDIAIAGIVGNKVLDIADKFTELTGKIRVNTDTEAQAVAIRQRLVDISLRTHTSLESNVEDWEKLTNVGRIYHKSQNDILKLQENLLKGLRVGGATPQAAQNSMQQLVMLLNQGRASAIGFNAIFRQAPELMSMLAKEMGKPLTFFTQMRKQGPEAIKGILEALQKIGPEVDKKFAQLPLTMKEGFTDAKTAFEVMLGQIADKMKVSGGVGGFFERMAGIFRDPKFIDGVAKFANMVGNVLLKALNLLASAFEFIANHAAGFKAVMEVLAVLMGVRLATTALKLFGILGGGAGVLFKLGQMANTATKALIGLSLVNKADAGAAGAKAAANAFRAAQAGAGAYAVAATEAGEAAAGAGASAEAAAPLLLNPWVAGAAAVAALGGALWILGDQIDASGKHAYTAKDVMVGAFLGAKDLITSGWSAFPSDMGVFFSSAADKAAQAAKSIVGSFMAALNWISRNVPGTVGAAAGATAGALGLGAKGIQGSDVTKLLGDAVKQIPGVGGAIGVGSALINLVKPGIDAAGKRGHQSRLDDYMDNLSKVAPLPMKMPNLDAKLGGGPPLGSAPGKKGGADKAGEAMKALQDYIDELTRAIEEQKKMNAAVLEGPAAERAVAVEMAKSKAALSERQKLEKAGIDVKKNATAAAKVAEAADAAGTLELEKQQGERNKLTKSIKEQTQALKDQTQDIYAGLQVYTADENLRRQRLISLAREQAIREKMREYGKQEYKDLTPKELTAVNDAGNAAAGKANADYMNTAVSKFNELLKASHTPMQQQLDDWKAIRDQMLALEPVMIALHQMTQQQADAVNHYLQQIKPPENLFEAMRSGIKGFKDDFEMTWSKVSDGIKGTISDLANNFTEMVVNGKVNFKSLALSVVRDLETMIVKAIMFKVIMAALNAVVPGLGSFLAPVAGKHTGGFAGGADRNASHSVSPEVFNHARRYHTGGNVAGMAPMFSGLKHNEVPIIALRDEAVMPTARAENGGLGIRAMIEGTNGHVVLPTKRLRDGTFGVSLDKKVIQQTHTNSTSLTSLTSVHRGAKMFNDMRRFHTGGIVSNATTVMNDMRRYHDGGMVASMPQVSAPVSHSSHTTVFSPNIKIDLGGESGPVGGGKRKNDGDGMSPEMKQKLSAMLEDELNIHLQRKFEDWTRPGGQLDQYSRHRR
jgi:tape measure domain-containing protein